jgi:thioredoxin 1
MAHQRGRLPAKEAIMFKRALATLFVFAMAAVAVARDNMKQPDVPPIFDKRPYNEARKGAEEASKWFIVKATASWCLPCKQMDKTTWRDDQVVKWLKEHAVAAAFDVDREKALAKELSIQAMPTMIAFKDGKEFDRIVGYKRSDEFLAWLEGIDQGKKSVEIQRDRAGAWEGNVDVGTRMGHAKELDFSGKLDEAADEYAWLWKHMLEYNAGYSAVRVSFLASDMERLASKNENAKRKFVSIRDDTARLVMGESVDSDDLLDWVVLNRIVGEGKETLGWYDRVKGDPRWTGLIRRVSRELTKLFIAEKRWSDLGLLPSDPLDDLDRRHEIDVRVSRRDPPPNLPEAERKQLEAMSDQRLRDEAAYQYAGLLAAGREREADAYATRAREYDTSPKMVESLVATALEAGQARPFHLEWLGKAGLGNNALTERVKTATSSPKR